MQQMADTDTVVATRYHNVVCALRLSKPMKPIGYAEKNDALLRELGRAEFCQHVGRLDLELLTVQTARLIAERPTFERRLRDALTGSNPPARAGGPDPRHALQRVALAGGACA